MSSITRALVIGGNGFIGAPTCDALSQAGFDVTAFDRFSGGSRHFYSDSVKSVQGDFLSANNLEKALEGQDVVFHFLSLTTPATASDDPLHDIRTNVTHTIELLQLCVRQNIRHVYFASTGGAIYGDQMKWSYNESDGTYPISPYAIGKLTVEHYLAYFKKNFGLEYTIFRISNPYGPGQHPEKVQGLIPISLRNVLAERALNQIGDGSMVRDFIYIDDLVNMIVAVATGAAKHHCYNLGSGIGTSVEQVLKAVEAVVGRELEVKQLPKPKTFIDHVVLDVSRFEWEFGQPNLVSLQNGIAKTWDALQHEKRR